MKIANDIKKINYKKIEKLEFEKSPNKQKKLSNQQIMPHKIKIKQEKTRDVK